MSIPNAEDDSSSISWLETRPAHLRVRPSSRYYHTCVSCESLGILLFGGCSGIDPLGDLFLLQSFPGSSNSLASLDGSFDPFVYEWTELLSSGVEGQDFPLPRFFHTAACVQTRDLSAFSMVVFGGSDGKSLLDGTDALNDIYRLDTLTGVWECATPGPDYSVPLLGIANSDSIKVSDRNRSIRRFRRRILRSKSAGFVPGNGRQSVMWGTTGAHRHRTGGGSFQSESPRKIADQTRSKSHMEMRSRRDFSESWSDDDTETENHIRSSDEKNHPEALASTHEDFSDDDESVHFQIMPPRIAQSVVYTEIEEMPCALIFGGWCGSERYNDVWIYFLDTGSWCLFHEGGKPEEDRIPSISGISLSVDASKQLSEEESMWAIAPAPRGGHAACIIDGGSKMLIHGGDSSFDFFDDVWIFHTQFGFWQPVYPSHQPRASHPAGRNGHSMNFVPFSSDGRTSCFDVVLFGGDDGAEARADVFVLRFSVGLRDGELTDDIPSTSPNLGEAHLDENDPAFKELENTIVEIAFHSREREAAEAEAQMIASNLAEIEASRFRIEQEISLRESAAKEIEARKQEAEEEADKWLSILDDIQVERNQAEEEVQGLLRRLRRLQAARRKMGRVILTEEELEELDHIDGLSSSDDSEDKGDTDDSDEEDVENNDEDRSQDERYDVAHDPHRDDSSNSMEMDSGDEKKPTDRYRVADRVGKDGEHSSDQEDVRISGCGDDQSNSSVDKEPKNFVSARTSKVRSRDPLSGSSSQVSSKSPRRRLNSSSSTASHPKPSQEQPKTHSTTGKSSSSRAPIAANRKSSDQSRRGRTSHSQVSIKKS